jgi:hypothetical protein
VARASPIVAATNAGEMSPTLEGRVDLAKYAAGCKRLENFLSLIQGPAIRRGGTRFVAEVKASSDVHPWLVKFEFSASQCFHIEFGDEYCRFFTNHGQVVVTGVAAWVTSHGYVLGDLVVQTGVNYYCAIAHTSGTFATDLAAGKWYALTGSIYEIPSPYALADLTNADGTFALQVEQSGDVLYIANMYGTYPPQTLTRRAATDWTFGDYAPNDGPFLESNATSTTLQASANTGSVTLTASTAIFASTDIGRLVRIEQENYPAPWETNKNYSTLDIARYDGKTYIATNNATSGTSPPIHEQGSARDGIIGVPWSYNDPGYGILLITAYTSPTAVTATVITNENNGLNKLPGTVVSDTSKRWSLGAWSDTTSYPTTVAFFLGRLFWGYKVGVPRLAGSVADDFSSMAQDFFNEVTPDAAIVRILASREVNDILWLTAADKLIVGTGGGEFIGGPISTSQAMGPANFEIVPQSSHRVRAVRPLIVGSSLVYAQRAGRKLLSLEYDFSSDRYTSTDRAVLADRITRPGVIGLAYQGEPNSVVWAWLSSGALRSFTFDQPQDVQGWARHPLGGDGLVESASCGPAPDGSREELWLIVKRTINGATKRYVEFMERPWEGDDDDGTPGDDQEDAFYVDCGLTYDSTPASTMSGLEHLEGETVQILADGAVQPDQVVTSGEIVLSIAASVVHAGLSFKSRIVPMRLEAGSQTGSSQGKIKRIDSLVLRLLDSLGGKVGQYKHTLDDLSLRDPATPMGSPPPFFSGDVVVKGYSGDYETEGLIEIVQDQPLPFCVVAILPQMKAYDP